MSSSQTECGVFEPAQKESISTLSKAVITGALVVASTLILPEDLHEPPMVIDVQDLSYEHTSSLVQNYQFVTAVDQVQKDGKLQRGGSGLLIDGYILSAGHVYGAGLDAKLDQSCDKQFSATQPQPGPQGKVNVEEMALKSVAAQSFTAGRPGYSDIYKPDLAVFAADAHVGMGMPRSSIASNGTKLGDVLTFTNYQTDISDGGKSDHWTPRHPSGANSKSRKLAVFKGVVLGRKGQRIGVLTSLGLESQYRSDDNDDNLEHGGSGGPVWNASGEVVGIAANMSRAISLKYIKDVFNVKISGQKPNHKYTLDWIQPVDDKTFNKLVNHQAPCDFDQIKLQEIRAKQPLTFAK